MILIFVLLVILHRFWCDDISEICNPSDGLSKCYPECLEYCKSVAQDYTIIKSDMEKFDGQVRRLETSVTTVLNISSVQAMNEIQEKLNELSDRNDESDSRHAALESSLEEVKSNMKMVTCSVLDDMCDKDWNGHCYRLFWILTNFQEADSICKDWGGNLPSIHSSAENDIIYEIGRKYTETRNYQWVWIGLNDKVTENSWKWTDGTPIDYTSWQPGHPTVSTTLDAVRFGLHSYAKKWWQCDENTNYPFICKKDLPSYLKNIDCKA